MSTPSKYKTSTSETRREKQKQRMKSIGSWTGSSTDAELLHRCKKVITSLTGDADVILYGSRARGDARQDWDYDILVIANRPVNMALEEKIVGGVFSPGDKGRAPNHSDCLR
jgi:predicted nucleotidyltransferase